MQDMIQDETARAAVRTVPAIAPAPLADVVCCHDIPEVRGNILPSVEPQLALNEVFDGRFLVREIVGRSGMATIYRAEDLQHDRRDVALKVPLMSVESGSIAPDLARR